MKILLINCVCGRQSTGRIVSDIKKSLIENGHDCRIAYGEKNSIADDNDYHIGNEIIRYIHAGLTRLFDASGFGSHYATKKFLEWVDAFDPDVIHLHNIHGYYINISLLFRYLHKCGKKIIWTLHDCWAFTGHSAYCDAIGCEKWQSGCYKCPQKSEYPASYIDCSKRNWTTKKELFCEVPNLTIVTPSDWLANNVKRSFLSRYPVKVIHNGIDLTQFHPKKDDIQKRLNIQNTYILLGVASPWNEMKGLLDYLKLATILGDEYKIVLVGLENRQKKRLPSNVLGISGTNSTEELSSIYSAANVLLNLSYCENYPTVNIEAAACGTPVITYNTGGSPESARMFGGIVVEKGNLDAVAKAITAYRKEHPFKESLDADLSYIDKKTAIQRVLDLYKEAF